MAFLFRIRGRGRKTTGCRCAWVTRRVDADRKYFEYHVEELRVARAQPASGWSQPQVQLLGRVNQATVSDERLPSVASSFPVALCKAPSLGVLGIFLALAPVSHWQSKDNERGRGRGHRASCLGDSRQAPALSELIRKKEADLKGEKWKQQTRRRGALGFQGNRPRKEREEKTCEVSLTGLQPHGSSCGEHTDLQQLG
jgi:hypothetical protein